MANTNPPQTPERPAPQEKARRASKFSLMTVAAYAVAAVGIVLIVVSGVYIYSRSRSGSDADEFAYSISEGSLDSYLGRSASPANSSEGYPSTVTDSGAESGDQEPIPLEPIVAPAVTRFANLYPGDQLNPKYWSEPEWAGSDPFGGPTIPDDFVAVLSTDLFRDFDPTAEAIRIRIPSINLTSSVAELDIVDLGDQKSYQTPDNTVGHIPETSSPGQQGSGWFFGHLESFAAREGSIFRHLPEITELIRQDPVDVYLETPDAEYIYRVTGTSQIHQSELHLSSTSDAQITLVTCWPPRVYDQRVLVDATLIAYRPL
ncbi:MAG TPA: sortase [Dehalococcoidia bacterium]|jgi:LPXTG-site transpeptidase (sortase) family protein|nr:sortase [Dehalococcoidia bacterium]HIK88586.1 sortase [Dehalococcoidia bacterium]